VLKRDVVWVELENKKKYILAMGYSMREFKSGLMMLNSISFERVHKRHYFISRKS
jgi:hypothetical protein